MKFEYDGQIIHENPNFEIHKIIIKYPQEKAIQIICPCYKDNFSGTIPSRNIIRSSSDSQSFSSNGKCNTCNNRETEESLKLFNFYSLMLL